jgi:hypothetical protein
MQHGGEIPAINRDSLTDYYSKYPGLSKVYGPGAKGLTIKADTNFTPSAMGYGNIEFFDKGLDSVRYFSNQPWLPHGVRNPQSYANPSPDMGYGILYNPKAGITTQDVFLDMLHGMKSDAGYAKLREEFKKQAVKDRDRDIRKYYEADKAKGLAGDGYDQWVDNYVDGLIRSEFFEGSDSDYTIERRGNSPAMKARADSIKQYLRKQARGGTLAYGGVAAGKPVITQYPTGGTHEQNPYGGNPIDAMGNVSASSGMEPVALGEEGELSVRLPGGQTFMFSNRILRKKKK